MTGSLLQLTTVAFAAVVAVAVSTGGLVVVGAVPVEKNSTKSQPTQDVTNKEKFVPIPVNNDKIRKLSDHDNHHHHRHGNNNLASADSTARKQDGQAEVKIGGNSSPEDRTETKPKASGKTGGRDENTKAPYAGRPSNDNDKNGNNKRSMPILGNLLLDEEPRLLRDQRQHRYRSSIDGSVADSGNFGNFKRVSAGFEPETPGTRVLDSAIGDGSHYSDYEELIDYEPERMARLAQLLGGAYGDYEPLERASSRNEAGLPEKRASYWPRYDLEGDQSLVPVEYDAYRFPRIVYGQDPEVSDDDDVMDGSDLAAMMLEEEAAIPFLNNYIRNAVATGLLDPRLADNYRLNVMKEYSDLLRAAARNDFEDTGRGIQRWGRWGEGGRESEGIAARGVARQIIPTAVGFERRIVSSPLSVDPEKSKKSLQSEGDSMNDRQQELEEFTSMLKQAHLESDLENMVRKTSARDQKQ